jgi:hypothetical protein
MYHVQGGKAAGVGRWPLNRDAEVRNVIYLYSLYTPPRRGASQKTDSSELEFQITLHDSYLHNAALNGSLNFHCYSLQMGLYTLGYFKQTAITYF